MVRLALPLALLASLPVAADWARLDGKDAPPLQIKQWFNPSDALAFGDFRGKAVLVEFWATW